MSQPHCQDQELLGPPLAQVQLKLVEVEPPSENLVAERVILAPSEKVLIRLGAATLVAVVPFHKSSCLFLLSLQPTVD